MKIPLMFGATILGLLFCLGCAGSKPPSTEAETKDLYESPDYSKQMMGEETSE